MPHLTLSSASPRRRDLLARLGIAPDVVAPSDIDERPMRGEGPRDYAIRMAREKAAAIEAPGFVLAGDTVVAAGRRILPKTEEVEEARGCLALISGRRHTVLSSIALKWPDKSIRLRLSENTVRFKSLSRDEIEDYLASGEWRGKAGGYAIQGQAESLIQWIRGSHSSIMGLPLFETRAMLKAAGFAIA